MTCTFWATRQNQCGRAAVALVGKTLGLCGDHDIAFIKSVHTLRSHEPSAARPHSFTYGTLFARLGYREIA